MLTYPKQAIEYAVEQIEKKEYAKPWLQKNNYDELVKLTDAVIYRDSKAVEFLLLKKHFVLTAFVNAVWDDKKALKILLDKKEFAWAAMANFINGDKNAGAFLKKAKMDDYLRLAEKIHDTIRKLNDKNTSFFNSGPFKV